MNRVEKVATPLEAVTVAVPPSVPPAGLGSSATVTLADEFRTVLPKASCTSAVAGAITTPAIVLAGWAAKASFAGPAWVTLNATDAAPVSVPEVADSV